MGAGKFNRDCKSRIAVGMLLLLAGPYNCFAQEQFTFPQVEKMSRMLCTQYFISHIDNMEQLVSYQSTFWGEKEFIFNQDTIVSLRDNYNSHFIRYRLIGTDCNLMFYVNLISSKCILLNVGRDGSEKVLTSGWKGFLHEEQKYLGKLAAEEQMRIFFDINLPKYRVCFRVYNMDSVKPFHRSQRVSIDSAKTFIKKDTLHQLKIKGDLYAISNSLREYLGNVIYVKVKKNKRNLFILRTGNNKRFKTSSFSESNHIVGPSIKWKKSVKFREKL